MFDFHMHSIVSFDGHDTAQDMVQAAADAGLKEMCFTDHIDYDPFAEKQIMLFDTENYIKTYQNLCHPTVKIRRGMEFGMTPDNMDTFKKDLQRYPFDFVLGSIHFVDGLDVYFQPYWEDKTVHQAERRYLENTLECVRNHDDFDVLAHLTYISKCRCHPAPRPVPYAEHEELLDEILRVLAQKGKGLEINTSGVDKAGVFLPAREHLQRFKELGGEIVTVGSDAHDGSRVGQYVPEALELLRDVFGHVCTFESRKPVFHKL
jgi:histidinol-phosphatase (PHP family)